MWKNTLYSIRSMFLARFFWVFYHSNIRPMLELGSCWPTRGIYLLYPLEVPLFNTSILPTSGIFIISVHHCLIEGNHKQILQPMFITIALRVYIVINFTVLWKSLFLTALLREIGCHGSHIIINTELLIIYFWHQLKFYFTSNQCFRLEAAVWYWPLENVIWLFFYVLICWWGAYFSSTNSTTDFKSATFDINPREKQERNNLKGHL